MQFQIGKNGYEKKEVDSYVASLELELKSWKERALKAEEDYIIIKEKENEIKRKGENIALALTAAIDKAKQIEASSKNVYKLKIQQISILYDRWESLLNEILDKNPPLENSHNIKKMVDEFKKTIESVINKDFNNQLASSGVNQGSDNMRALLSKMSRYNKSGITAKIERGELSNDIREGETELKRLSEKTMIKPITDITLEKNDNYETLVDKFLTEEPNSYNNILVKNDSNISDSGFDLQEAINPKEELEEIMKAFDFYYEGTQKNNADTPNG